jgi:histidinol-phosphate aminotransferase
MNSPLLRPELSSLSPYNAGLTVAEVASRPGVIRVAKLGSNENPLGPDPAVRQALETALQCVSIYPDPSGRSLSAKLATRHGIGADRVVLRAAVQKSATVAAA